MNLHKYLFKEDYHGTETPTTLGKVVCGLFMAGTFLISAFIISRLIGWCMVLFA